MIQYHVGTIGFSYASWQDVFYPSGVRSSDYLAAYSAAFDCVELDTTFYGIPAADRIAKWIAATPAGFQFCPKTPRQITHDAPPTAAAMRDFLKVISPMHAADRLGPILVQFPPTFTVASQKLLADLLAGLPTEYRYAVELRHRSWSHPATLDLLTKHRCAWVAADFSRGLSNLISTTDFVYVRLVGEHGRHRDDVQEREDTTPRLEHWIHQMEQAVTRHQKSAAQPQRAYVVVSNDYAGFGPDTANRLRRLLNLTITPPQVANAQASLF